MKVYYLALSFFLTFFFAHQITHVMCFGRYRDKKCKKIKFYFIYGFWVVFFGILCTMMGSASGVDHTFDYGMNSLELYLGKKIILRVMLFMRKMTISIMVILY